MIEAVIAIAIGAALARTVLWPIQVHLQRRTEEQEYARAQEIVARVNARRGAA